MPRERLDRGGDGILGGLAVELEDEPGTPLGAGRSMRWRIGCRRLVRTAAMASAPVARAKASESGSVQIPTAISAASDEARRMESACSTRRRREAPGRSSAVTVEACAPAPAPARAST